MHRHYFFKIEFVFFLYLLLSASWKENELSWYISVIRQTVGYWTPVFTQPFSCHFHITITYNLPQIRLWYVDVVTVFSVNTGSRLPNISDVKTWKRRSMVGIDMIRYNRVQFWYFNFWTAKYLRVINFETTNLGANITKSLIFELWNI
jgi:hypothetical protein